MAKNDSLPQPDVRVDLVPPRKDHMKVQERERITLRDEARGATGWGAMQSRRAKGHKPTQTVVATDTKHTSR